MLPNINTLSPRQNAHHFRDNIFHINLNENVKISIEISLMFVSNDPIKYIPVLVQIMAWPCPGHKPLSEPIMISLLMSICIPTSMS